MKSLLFLFRKHSVNQILEMFGDDFASDLQAGRHLAVVDGPLTVDQLKAFHFLKVAKVFVVVVHLLAIAVVDSLVLHHFGICGIRNVILFAPGLQMLEVGHNQGGGKLLVLSHYHDAIDKWRFGKTVLNQSGNGGCAL